MCAKLIKKDRLDSLLVSRKHTASRHQAVALIMSGRVLIDGKAAIKAGQNVDCDSRLEVLPGRRYVSRGGLKLASIANNLKLNFKNRIVLDVGSSTGGFTDYALQHGAAKVYAVDVGTNQLDFKLRQNPQVVVMEKTDIRNLVKSNKQNVKSHTNQVTLLDTPDIVLIDVSFISLRLVLPAVIKLANKTTAIVAMVKPQFEAGKIEASKNRGVIKNDTIRRQILKDFETWAKVYFVIKAKADSEIAGAKGNLERFYLLYLHSH